MPIAKVAAAVGKRSGARTEVSMVMECLSCRFGHDGVRGTGDAAG